MSTHTITITVNGTAESLHVPANMTLLQLLRERLALTGTKNGCAAGECGACTVLMNGEPVNACMVLAVEADGAEVVTVEGLARAQGEGERGGQGEGERGGQGEGETLHPLQQAFIDQGAVQCGFCTPGMLLSAYALLQRNPAPSADDIRAALVGNLCRCTGYARIVQAVEEAGSRRQEAGGKAQEAGCRGQDAGSRKEGGR